MVSDVSQCLYLMSDPGIFLAILGRGPRAFQIGKISDVNPKFGKFSWHSKSMKFYSDIVN